MSEIKQVGYRSPGVLAVLAPSPVSRGNEDVLCVAQKRRG